MSDLWLPLVQELSIWRDQGASLPFWWRDDDAVTVTPQLRQLSDLSLKSSVPVHLAVVPHGMQPDLPQYLDANRNLVPMIHGWAHQNHAPVGQKKAEFGNHRPAEVVLRDAKSGVDRLRTELGDLLVLMFVPPWNRINPDILVDLPALGIQAISTFTPRTSHAAAPGLQQINTHFDPIAWKSGKQLIAPDVLIAQLVQNLQDRRAGRVDRDEPLGLLTHHLVHTPEIWDFLTRLLDVLTDGPICLFDARQDLNKDKAP